MGEQENWWQPGWGIPNLLLPSPHAHNERERRSCKIINTGLRALGQRTVGEQSSQRLRAILLEITNGWWDLYSKDMGFAVKFCWSDPDFKLSPTKLKKVRMCKSPPTFVTSR
jgi:hypothetical protein